MAYKAISNEDAGKYAEFKGRAGETVTAEEYASVLRKHNAPETQTTAEKVAARKKKDKAAEVTPPAGATTVLPPAKSTAPKAKSTKKRR